jgi:hypothetical protein
MAACIYKKKLSFLLDKVYAEIFLKRNLLTEELSDDKIPA